MSDDPYEARRVRTPEEHLTAALLRLVLELCASDTGALDSRGRAASNAAMELLAEDGFICIDDAAGGRIRATVLPEAAAFLAWMAKADDGTA